MADTSLYTNFELLLTQLILYHMCAIAYGKTIRGDIFGLM